MRPNFGATPSWSSVNAGTWNQVGDMAAARALRE